PCVQVFPFGRTFWMARTTNLASRGTLGCVGISTLTKSCPEGQGCRPSFSDKVWIQHDGTENGIAHELEAAGIPKKQIVLAFKPITNRQLTEYAVS
ncbi:MAG: element excision factor XisI family protein, partial [Synechocystis sp.]|nr:element excision factor XisI family protein [Synechocystis sp.]